MAQQIPSKEQIQFGGVVTAGLPVKRPEGSAARCHNLRPLPMGGIRPRGGRTRMAASVAGRTFLQFYEFRKSARTGGVFHLAQVLTGGGEKWQQLDLGTYSLTDLETLGAIGTGTMRPLAITTVRDKVFFTNGQGTRSGNSKPALSSWDGTQVRYVGLDAYCPSATPTVSFAAGAGNNEILNDVTIYVGLYNTATGHFSNGVRAGKLTTPGTGTITVGSLSNLTTASHAGTEATELKYVFYATIDGAEVPYLILNAGGTDVLTASIGAGSVLLSLTTETDQGFILDLTHEMPTENFPPRPMSQVCYVNGRVYGVLQGGGTGSAGSYGGFSYDVPDRDMSAVGWSAAADDYQDLDFLGVPEESFPLANKKYAPNGERPIKLAESPNRDQLLVITTTGTFFLEETADGTHVYTTVSTTQGIGDIRTYVKTAHGSMWLDQFNQLVLLRPGRLSLDVLSEGYAELLTIAYGNVGVTADYLLDPQNQIDRYQVWSDAGYFVIHDFALERGQVARGVPVCPAYTGVGLVYSATRTLLDASGRRHHLGANSAIFAQEAHPLSGQVPTRDQNADGSFVEITGEWMSQWLDYGDSELRKEISNVLILGDAGPSAALGGVNGASISYFLDLSNSETAMVLWKSAQSNTNWTYGGKLDTPHCFWIKYKITLRGHSADGWLNYPNADSTTGNVPPNLYATLAEVRLLVSGLGENRAI